jgi:hypothetical protein
LTWKDRLFFNASLRSYRATIIKAPVFIKTFFMTDDNYVFLTKALEKIGFETELHRMLLTEMKLDRPEFSFQMAKSLGEASMKFDIHFVKSDKIDRYYIKDINSTLSRNGAEDATHNFQLYKSQGYDTREMKNMLEGRSVFAEYTKDDRLVQLWRQIDFMAKDEYKNNVVRSYYNNNNKFDLGAELGKLPFNGKVTRDDKEMMLNALKRGDIVTTVLRQGANVETMYLIAAPDVRAIQVFNKQGDRVSISDNQLRVITPEKKEISSTTEQLVNAADKTKDQNNDQLQTRSRRAS